MKTMKNSFGLRGLTYISCALLMFIASCSDNNKIDFTTTDATNVEGESTSDSFSADAMDVSTDVVSLVPTTLFGGREGNLSETVTGLGDNDRLKCATVTIVRSANSTADVPSGVITIVYPADGSCKDSRGIARKGTITITYTGRKFAVNSRIVTTFTNYTVAGVKIEGTYTLTSIAAVTEGFPRFTIVIVGGKVTFLDGKTVTREQNFTREWQRVPTAPATDKWVLLTGGTASGTNRDGVTYNMSITKDLVYSRACEISDKVFIAVSGEKTFTSGDKKMTIGFGDGTCDNKVTITINGKSKDVVINGDGN